MSQTINVPRELLERLLYVMDNYVTHETSEEDQLRAILAAPRQPEGDGLQLDDDAFYDEFAAWWESDGQYVRAGGGNYERSFAFQAWRHLMPKVAELREECERLRAKQGDPAGSFDKCMQAIAERDTLRQQLAERDAQIASMRAEVTPFIDTHWRPVAEQRDRLAELLRYARRHVAATRYPDNDEGDYHERRRDGLLRNIDAALAEVKP